MKTSNLILNAARWRSSARFLRRRTFATAADAAMSAFDHFQLDLIHFN